MQWIRKLGTAAALRLGLVALFGAGLSACASGGGGGPMEAYRAANLRPYEVDGRRYRPHLDKHYEQTGLASWYSYPNGSRRTASGEWYNSHRLTAAHKTLPLPCIVEVTNLENGKKIKVRVNDRGPFAPGRIIDLTPAAAILLGFKSEGVARVRVKFVGPAPVAESDRIMLAKADPAASGDVASALF